MHGRQRVATNQPTHHSRHNTKPAHAQTCTPHTKTSTNIGLRASFNPGKPQDGYAIHVKGKSGLKQTRVVLDCWAKHPEWPPLVVVGKASDEELTPPSRAAANMIYFPPITPPATAGGGNGTPSTAATTQLIDAARLRDMQGAASMHLCPSVREGFGHYLNEARAVGALVVTV